MQNDMYTTELRIRASVAAAKGAALLDDHAGEGWRDDVNSDMLSMGSMSECVLGQLYGGYAHGLTELDLPRELDIECEYGFFAYGTAVRSAHEEYHPDAWLILRDAWIAELGARP